jgi:tartrate-resistant acid phosphatase type 5
MHYYKSLVGAALSLAPLVNALPVKEPPQPCASSTSATIALIGDYGWTGWQPANENFCNNILPNLQAANIDVSMEIINDCTLGDAQSLPNATVFQEKTASYLGEICDPSKRNCSAIISVGDSFYDSGVAFDTAGINQFEIAFQQMYNTSRGQFYENTTWYMSLGNHDVVRGWDGVNFQTQIAPLMDSRWYFGTEGLPYYSYDLQGEDWSATFAVVDSDCFIEKYQLNTSVYYNNYTIECHQDTQTQVDFVEQAFANSNADWKFLTIHHPYLSSSDNYTELAPVIEVAQKYNGVVMNGHDHCMAHYQLNDTNYVLTGGGGYTQAGDCNNGVALGPFVKFLGANAVQAANGFVLLEISKDSLTFDYYLRNMQYEHQDLFPVKDDKVPYYSFTINN